MPRGFRFRTPRVRDPARVRHRRCRRPSRRPRRVTSTAARWTRRARAGASNTADGELAESQSHRKPELREGARGDDAGNSARDASSEPEDPVERFAVMRALETLRDDDAEPHERTSACERLRDFARATPVLAERHREMQGLVETCLPILARVFHPFPRAASDGPPRDDADVRAAALRAYIAAAYGQRETDDDDDAAADAWRKNVSAVEALAATATSSRAAVAPRVSALDVIGRCAGEVRGIFADRARGDSDSRGGVDVDSLDERFDERFRATVEAVVRTATSTPNEHTDEEWAAAMECACRLGPHYHPPGDASATLGAELVRSLGCSNDRVAGSANRGKLAWPDVIDDDVATSSTRSSRSPRPRAARRGCVTPRRSPWAAWAPRGLAEIGGIDGSLDERPRWHPRQYIDGTLALDGTLDGTRRERNFERRRRSPEVARRRRLCRRGGSRGFARRRFRAGSSPRPSRSLRREPTAPPRTAPPAAATDPARRARGGADGPVRLCSRRRDAQLCARE